MKLLLLNTCGSEGSFALAETSLVGSVKLVTMPGRSASEMLVRLLRETMADLGWKSAELGAIAVVTGPGSFTGVRVGLSVAKGLCEASGAPLIAVSRLELLAAAAAPGSSSVCALLDAGRGEFYCGRYQAGEPLGEALLSKDEALAACAHADKVMVCEDAIEVALADSLPITRVTEPSAADAMTISLRRLEQGDFVDAATIDANYLRRTDAEIFASKARAG